MDVVNYGMLMVLCLSVTHCDGETFIIGHISKSSPQSVLTSYAPVMENSASAINIAVDKFRDGPLLGKHNIE